MLESARFPTQPRRRQHEKINRSGDRCVWYWAQDSSRSRRPSLRIRSNTGARPCSWSAANFGPLARWRKASVRTTRKPRSSTPTCVAFVSKLPLEGFVPGTDTGETKAKPEIWQDMDDFKAKMDKMNQETAKLSQVAQSGDFEAVKAQVGETGKACKACHDKYRNK